MEFRKNKVFKAICFALIFSFLTNSLTYAAPLNLPNPQEFIPLSSPYSFPVLKGLKFDPANPLQMEFIINTASESIVSQDDAARLIRYFMAGLTIPEQDVWVNLSPYEKDRVAPPALSETDLGRDLLSQDYILKQISASVVYPESSTGQDFWARVYDEVYKIAKTTKVPVNTFNKIWIVPETAEVYENNNAVLVKDAKLKALLEEDYLALKNSNQKPVTSNQKKLTQEEAGRINQAASMVMKEVILPKINEDVNSGKNFATLRQIYNSYILAVWFKQKFKNSFYQHYFNQNKIKGIDLSDKDAQEKIYNLYVEAFQRGLYNYTKSEYDQRIRKKLKRQYFSGGSALGNTPALLKRNPMPDGLPNYSGAGKDVALRIAASPLTKDSPQIIDPLVLLREATLDALPENIKGRKVLVNLDINVPAEDGHILNSEDNPHQRIIAAAETLKELAEKGAIVVAMFHQGRFGEDDFMDTPEEHAAQLSRVMGRPVKTVDDLFGEKAIEAISRLRPGDILLLKPVRAKDPSITGKTLEESPYFVPTLRPLFDYFVAEDFPKRHRETNSVVGFSGLPALIGRSMQKEIEGAEEILHLKRPNLLVVGGGKIEEKLQEVQESLKKNKTDYVLIGGKLSSLFLIAAQGEAATASSQDRQYQLAVKTVGKATADDLKDDLSELPDLNQLITKYREKISLPVDMVYFDENDKRKEVVLKNGRVGEGFKYLLKGIGPQTAQIFSRIISSRTELFQSAMVVGPLSDSSIESFLPEIKGVLSAVSQIPFWTTRGGDTLDLINRLGFSPSFVSLAGGASIEYNIKKGNLKGIEFLIANKIGEEVPFAPVNDVEAQILAHATILRLVADAIKKAGARLVVRTEVFGRGDKVDATQIRNNPEKVLAIKTNIGEKPAQEAISNLEISDVNTQNPWIDYSLITLSTKNGYGINADSLAQILAEEKDVVLFEIPAEQDKKGKPGKPGQIDTKKLAEKWHSLLLEELAKRGIDKDALKTVAKRALPAFTQVSRSDIPGQLKLAVFIPTPKSDIGRLMQLAQDSGINLKELIEKAMPAPKIAEKPVPLLSDKTEPPSISKERPVVQPADNAEDTDILKGLKLGKEQINEVLQTIFSDAAADSFNIEDWENILRRIDRTKKLVRIIAPEGSAVEQALRRIEKNGITGYNIAIVSHPLERKGVKSRAFLIQPKRKLIFVGYGNINPQLAAAAKVLGMENPAVSVFSLNRPERVLTAFSMGYDIYLHDHFEKDPVSGKEFNVYDNPLELEKMEKEFKDALIDALRAKRRNIALEDIPASERRKLDNLELIRSAEKQGQEEAEVFFKQQYKGLLSKALSAGEFDLVYDGSADGEGPKNKEKLYKPALKKNPLLKIIYQGGEKAQIAEASFNAVTSDFAEIKNKTYVRQVSCNTTALSTIGEALLSGLGNIPLVMDNLAIRRVADAGDMKGGIITATLSTAYHHKPDVFTVISEKAMELLGQGESLNTDAAQSGASLSFHTHIMYIRRADGGFLSKKQVQQILAMQSRLALVDFPQGVFDTTRISELARNQFPKMLNWAPNGANHLLVPVITVQETDDPTELRLIFAVPQESIVGPSNLNLAHALLDLAGKDASLAIVNDAFNLTGIVRALETHLPVKGLTEPDAPGPHILNSPQDFEAVKEMAFNLLRKNGHEGISVPGLEDSRIALFNPAYSAEKVLEELASSKWTVKKVTNNGETRYFYRPFRLFTQANEQTNMQLQKGVVDGALVGHSESKEAHGLDNKKVNAILEQAHKLLGKMNVLALGESAEMRYPKGHAQEGKLTMEGWKLLEGQIREGLAGLTEEQILKTIIAYEPIWAIGEKAIRPATPGEAQEVHGFIRGILKKIIPGKENQVIIQYGGSMSADKNLAADLRNQKDIDGGLIGGASLTKKKALALIKMVVETVRKQKEAGTFNGRIPVLGFNFKAEIGGPNMEAAYLQELMDIFKFIQDNLPDIDLEEDIRIFFAVSQTDIPLFNRALMGENPLDLLDLSKATLPNGIELAVSINELSSFGPGAHTSDLTAEALKLAGVNGVVIGHDVDEAADPRVVRAKTAGLKIVKLKDAAMAIIRQSDLNDLKDLLTQATGEDPFVKNTVIVVPPVLVREAYAAYSSSSAMVNEDEIALVKANPVEYGGINLQSVSSSINSAPGSLPAKINVSSSSSADFAGFAFSIVEMNEISDANSFFKGSNVIYGAKQ